jgi:transcriptional regulator with XRE-family HTH domain
VEANTRHFGSCPPIEELREQLDDLGAELAEHVERCRRCRALVLILREGRRAQPATADRSEGAISEERPAAIEDAGRDDREGDRPELDEGAVVVASSRDAPGELLVAIVLDTTSAAASFGSLVVAPISAETRYAGEWDLLFDADQTPLGYPLIVELWNHGTLLREQVEEDRGFVVVDGWRRIDALYRAALGISADGEETIGAQLPEGRGPAILDDADPRAIFHDGEAERAARFWLPAARVLAHGTAEETAVLSDEADGQPLTVGAILSAWLDAQGYDAAEYAREIGFGRQELEAVCANRIDPLVLTADRLADVFVRPVGDLLELDEDDLDAALARSIEDSDWSHVPAYGAPATHARTAGLSGPDREEAVMRSRGASGPLAPEQQAQRKQAYRLDFRAALEDKIRR